MENTGKLNRKKSKIKNLKALDFINKIEYLLFLPVYRRLQVESCKKTKKMNIPVTKSISELSYIEIKEGE